MNTAANRPSDDGSRASGSAPRHSDWIAARLRGRDLALFLDYDGTLTPIVRRPEDATLAEETRTLLRQLATVCTVAIVSGRDRRDVEGMVRVENLTFAGSHGFDIRGPAIQMQHEDARRVLPELDDAEQALRGHIERITGAHVERKRFAVAVHYRQVETDAELERVEQAVDEVVRAHPQLRKKGGKKIFELQPDVEWDKGRAVLWLMDAMGLDHAGVVVIYIGDDVTDEDAFRVLRDRDGGIGIKVAENTADSQASYFLRDCDQVREFLKMLLGILERRRAKNE